MMMNHDLIHHDHGNGDVPDPASSECKPGRRGLTHEGELVNSGSVLGDLHGVPQGEADAAQGAAACDGGLRDGVRQLVVVRRVLQHDVAGGICPPNRTGQRCLVGENWSKEDGTSHAG